MTRICFFRLGAGPLFTPGCTDTFGGAEVRAATFARALARQYKHEISFAVADRPGIGPGNADGMRILPLPAKKPAVHKLQSSLHRRLFETPIPYRHFRRLDADVVACFGIHDPTASVIAAARHAMVRTMLFLTSDEDVQVPEAVTPKQRRHRRMHDFAICHADAIVAQSESQQRQLLLNFGRKSTLIRNPIDTLSCFPRAPESQRRVLWVGRADRDCKRADICWSLAQRCPEIPFTVVMNDADPDVYQELSSSLPANVNLQRHVPLAEIESYFAGATALINTSNSEGFPNTFLQAAKYGVPILSLRVDPDGMLRRHGCGQVAGTETRLAQQIQEAHANQSGYIAEAARDYVVRYHEVSQRAAELERAITLLLDQRQAA